MAIRSSVILSMMSFLLTALAALYEVQGQTETPPPSTVLPAMTARELYAAAAQEIDAQDPRSASLHLQGLLKHHPDSELAPTAAFFLSECQLAMKSPKAAYETLSSYSEWPDRLRETVKARKLFAARMAAAQDFDSGQRLDSIYWLVQAAADAEDASQSAIEKQIFQTANAELKNLTTCETASPDSIAQCFAALKNQCEIPGHLLPRLYFAAAENLRTAGKLTEAMQWYSCAEQAIARETASQDEVPWLKTVALRICEVLVAQRKFDQAKQRIDAELQKTPIKSSTPEHLAYLRLLQVRCQIAHIEFDEAFQTLDAVDALQDCSPSVYAQAGWMRGELYFMQRQYESAVAAYERVDRLDAEKWQSLALLQKAKCLEMLGRTQEAIAAYERVKTEFHSSPGLRTAEERLAALPRATTQTDNSREVTR